MVSLAPGQAYAIDLLNYMDSVGGNVSSGLVTVRYTGSPGSVVASFMEVGTTNPVGIGSGSNGNGTPGAPPSPRLVLFPNVTDAAPGDIVTFKALTDGSVSSPSWSVVSTTGVPGTISPQS